MGFTPLLARDAGSAICVWSPLHGRLLSAAA